MRRRPHMRHSEGTIDVALLLILLMSTIVPATFAVGTPDWMDQGAGLLDWMDQGAGLLVLYGGAIAVAVAAWRWIRRVIREARRHGAVLLGLDERLERVELRQVRIEKHIVELRQVRIEKHIGIEPLPDDPVT